jgi:hypothetical protein
LLTLIKSTKDSAEFCALNKIGNEVQKENFEVIYNNTSSNYQLIKYNNFSNSATHCIDLIISEKDDALNCTEEKKYEFKIYVMILALMVLFILKKKNIFASQSVMISILLKF